MQKTSLLLAVVIGSFCLGYAAKSILSDRHNKARRATGVGGIFFKCKNPAALRGWYKDHLGLDTNRFGTTFVWFQGADSTKKGYTQWSPFRETTKYFDPSTKDYMINYRVEDLDHLVMMLKNEGVTVLDSIQTASYGKFVHILDLEGAKVELWEPVDSEYGKFAGGKTL